MPVGVEIGMEMMRLRISITKVLLLIDSRFEKSYLKLVRNNGEYLPTLDFSPDYSNIQSETRMRGEGFRDYIDTMFENGMDENAFNQALQNMQDIDTDKIINELQKQLDNWRTENKK